MSAKIYKILIFTLFFLAIFSPFYILSTLLLSNSSTLLNIEKKPNTSSNLVVSTLASPPQTKDTASLIKRFKGKSTKVITSPKRSEILKPIPPQLEEIRFAETLQVISMLVVDSQKKWMLYDKERNSSFIIGLGESWFSWQLIDVEVGRLKLKNADKEYYVPYE